MYLKSLVLKGFKSFADRSVLTLQPGITAIVGPNGSGKSNISDAVLWVLGERNARHLRGQAMEDIIFSGSAARKAVSVAEVDLVLDNSDGTLPVEFDEVAITRRMYRSGESEYLVNGVISRRLDVLNILHDTGLGTGTHSIISQGSLDSILQSKPEDRRALIEEAAGVLKHKQRKEKSERKLASMDNHLERVNDVIVEVSRQLGPLERKAKRAAAYKEARASLDELKLALAVDDLRNLQKQWEGICQEEQEAASLVEKSRNDVADAERTVNDIQELMRRESEDAGELSRRHRRAAGLSDRLEGAEMLLRERRRSAVDYQADMSASLEASQIRQIQAQRELEAAEDQLLQASALCESASKLVDQLSAERFEAAQKRRVIEAEVEQLVAAVRDCEEKADEAKRSQSFLQESLSNNIAHVKVVEARKAELATELDRASEEFQKASIAAREAKTALDDVETREKEAQAAVVQRYELREQARSEREGAEAAVRMLESQIQALEQAIRVSRKDDPALAWLVDNADKLGGVPVSRTVKVASELESLVERLLGDDLSALAVKDAESASAIAGKLRGESISGDATLFSCEDAADRSCAARASGASALVDQLEYGLDIAPVIESLLGDIVICKSRDDAFAAHAADTLGLRYASLDGCVFWPNGRVRVFGQDHSADEGILARERRLRELRESLQASIDIRDESTVSSDKADEEYRAAQAEGLRLGQELASAKGAHAAALAEEERASRRMSSVADEVESIQQRLATARQSVDELRPKVEECAQTLSTLRQERDELVRIRDEKTSQAVPLRKEAGRLSEQLNDAKVQSAAYSERQNYAERIVIARKNDLASLDERAEEARKSMVTKQVAAERGATLLPVFAALSQGLAAKVRLLEDAVNAAESSTDSMHSNAAAARDTARRAHDDYDAASARMAQVRVQKSRLEVQVESAVNTVVVELATPLDVADKLPPLQDRLTAEDEAARLERRIKSMGTINPDAAEEYAELKERYDFLAGQLADMQAARRSLARITRVIDNRMKDDFIRTYEEVNENFKEIFGILFPGGTAYLTLDDPDDVDNAGVEVTAQPRGKRITKMMLMSGGEKSLTALALLFAVYRTRTTPFYILDEVEAALDDTNLRRLMSYVDTLRKSTQLIMITHQRRTMEMADVLFGVSMQADGVTKVISQKLERALEMAE